MTIVIKSLVMTTRFKMTLFKTMKGIWGGQRQVRLRYVSLVLYLLMHVQNYL